MNSSGPRTFLDFKERNLFYGWNGTGKSTLSNLFRSIEKKSPILESDVEFVISGENVKGDDLGITPGLPQVRVFNKDLITDNAFTSNRAVTLIFFLGEENIEKQKQVKSSRATSTRPRKKVVTKKRKRADQKRL